MLHDPSPLLLRRFLSSFLTVFLGCLAAMPALAISSRTLFTPTGAAANDNLGASVGTAGDFNGDGYADLIVGAPYNDAGGSNAGSATVYFGGPRADAVADLTLIGAAANDVFGISVGTAGDVNGDGYADIIVGAYANDAGGVDAGRAYVYYGGPSADAVADLTFTGAAASDGFGISVGTAGDVNGDGYADVIVGAHLNDTGGSNAGRAYVFFGGPSADAVADLTLTGAAASDFFGFSVGTAGDVNGDGFADVIVGAYNNDVGGVDAGRAYVYFGGPAADAVADLTLTGAAAGDFFGYSVGTAGDINGDGYADILVGAYANDAGGSSAGRAYVYLGGILLDTVADLTLTGSTAGDFLGFSVSTAGDVNGDGYADVIVGVYGTDAAGSNAGGAYVYFGGPSTDAVVDLALIGAAAADFFGYSVGAAGDVDGDGYADLIVGAFNHDGGGANAGRAYVTAVYPYQVRSPNGGEQWAAGQSATVRWFGRDVADLALSTDGGATWNTLMSGVGGLDENEITLVVPGPATTLARLRVSQTNQPVRRSTSDASDAVFRIVMPGRTPEAAHRLQLTPTGAAVDDNFGLSVGAAGDVNGDGFDDLIVGAYLNDAGGPDAGRAYVYFGGPLADAVADLTLTGLAADDQFGISVASAGDVNGDGFGDVIVGAYLNDAGGTNAGQAYVYYGGPVPDPVADLTLTGAAAGDAFGYAVGTAGDVNGDGFDDVIVGAIFSDAGGSNAGRAYVYFGGPSADAVADLTLTGAAANDDFGTSVGTAGDVNGDGFDDVIVGAYLNDAGGANAGRAYVYFGGPSADAVADLTLTGAAADDYFGYSVGTAGDFNGDGYADVIIGAYLNDAGGASAGRAYVFHGGPSADAVADLTLTGAVAGDLFGRSVGTAGDVNGDGYSDVIIGASGSDAGGGNAGRAYVYYGGPTADAVADRTFTGASASDAFGTSVGTAGDVNGDGFADVIVGAFLNGAGGSDAGRAYLYDCNRYFVVTPNDDEVWNVGAAQSVSWLGAERADLWLSVDGGRSYDLLRQNVGGSETNALSLLVPHAPTKFARVKVTTADPALTGQDESDSLFTIQSSVALLNLVASLGEGGAELTWSTDPGVGPEGLAGYRLYRLASGASGNGTRIGPDLITENRYTDPDGAPGQTYRLVAVNGLRTELELGRVALSRPVAGLSVWPSPVSRSANLTIAFAAPLGSAGLPVSDLEVGLFDLSGRRVATLLRGQPAARDGSVSLNWPARSLEPGLYFVRAWSPSASFRQEHRLVVVR